MFKEKKNNTQPLVIGTAVVGILSAAAALFLASKPGCQLRQDLAEKCSDMGETIQNWDLVKKALRKKEEPTLSKTHLLLGGIVGGVLAAATTLLLAPKSGRSLRRNIADKYQEITENEYLSQIAELNPFQKGSKLRTLLKEKKKSHR